MSLCWLVLWSLADGSGIQGTLLGGGGGGCCGIELSGNLVFGRTISGLFPMADEILQILAPSTPTRAEGQYLNHDGMNLPVSEDADRIQRRMSAESGDDKLKTQTTEAEPADWSDNSDSSSMSRAVVQNALFKDRPSKQSKGGFQGDDRKRRGDDGRADDEWRRCGLISEAGDRTHALPHQPPILKIDDDRSMAPDQMDGARHDKEGTPI